MKTTSPKRNAAKQSTARRKTTASRSIDAEPPTTSGTLYKDFTIWTGNTIPKWHPIRKMRYVFFRMIDGCTISDALREIHWDASMFWHLVDLKRHDPFREEYKRAKLLQARAMADATITIAEGRDAITRAHQRKMDRFVKRALRKISRKKSATERKVMLQQLFGDLREHDKLIISRNKLQIESARWIAKTHAPSEYGDKGTTIGITPANDGTSTGATTVTIQFVSPDGTVIAP